MLFGLNTIGTAAEPLEGNQAALEWLKRMEAPLWGVLAGTLFTVMVQSSSATLGVTIVLAGQGLLSLPAALAIMLGAEIGTCADTLAATAGRSRAAVRAGLFHLLFNLVTVALGIALIDMLAGFAVWSSAETGRQVANAHVAFNLVGALLVLSFTGAAALAMERLLPEGRGVDAPAQAAGSAG